MKAGALTPATLGGLGLAQRGAVRSMKAGALTPATPDRITVDGTANAIAQ